MLGAWGVCVCVCVGGGGGGCRNFSFYLKPVILRGECLKKSPKVDFEDMVHENVGLCLHLLMREGFQQFTLTAEVYDIQTYMTRYRIEINCD